MTFFKKAGVWILIWAVVGALGGAASNLIFATGLRFALQAAVIGVLAGTIMGTCGVLLGTYVEWIARFFLRRITGLGQSAIVWGLAVVPLYVVIGTLVALVDGAPLTGYSLAAWYAFSFCIGIIGSVFGLVMGIVALVVDWVFSDEFGNQGLRERVVVWGAVGMVVGSVLIPVMLLYRDGADPSAFVILVGATVGGYIGYRFG